MPPDPSDGTIQESDVIEDGGLKGADDVTANRREDRASTDVWKIGASSGENERSLKYDVHRGRRVWRSGGGVFVCLVGADGGRGDGDGDDASLLKRFKHKSVLSCKLNLSSMRHTATLDTENQNANNDDAKIKYE